MTAMTELSEEAVSVTAAEDQISLIETFKKTLDISQDVGLTDSKLELEEGNQDGERDTQQDGERDGHQDGERDGQQDGERDGQQDGERDGQQDGERDGQQDGERDGQQDGEMVSSPVAESTSSEQWVVGAECRAVWVEDGRLYPAKVVSLDGERCRVRFHGYNNEEEVELSTLQSPDVAVQQQRQNSQVVCVNQNWRAGSQCRAMYSEDGLVYPAVVLWVKGQRCRVRFNDYNNEEEQDISSLLSLDELHGPSKATTAKVSSSSDWKRSSSRRREDNQEEGERREEQHYSSSEVKEQGQKVMGTEIPTNHSFSFFPPFPPPPRLGSADSVTFIPPPPPPPPPLGGDATSSMLMLWYMCGFHTGSYMAQQEFKSSSKH